MPGGAHHTFPTPARIAIVDFEVRSARPEDVASILDVAHRAWHQAHAPIVGQEAVDAFLEEYYEPDSFRTWIADEDAVVLVAEAEESGVVGYAFGNPTDDASTFALAHVYVAPDRWGEGIGARLLERVEREATRRDYDRLTLGVLAENDRAIGFYESGGFERTDEFYDDRLDTRGFTYEKEL